MGDHICKRRLDRGLTQRNLGALLGVRAVPVANWELGRSKPHLRQRPEVIKFLDYGPSPADNGPPAHRRALRRRLGLTQRELAARLGLVEGTVADFELRRRRVSRRTAKVIGRRMSDLESRQVT